ncbi:Dse2p Ecym_6406 [Eremothecium cymbalariae DBVPG|uniref:Uncharacterized protein n=1 Tax=Eremothecium cymbalariae (strain CBS 270.75 / DBVPG 7215 / KCTC 17166 / NRRL Y-17582) TaxID=931890 RepID=G8JUJ9_ERECY|nr:hypothetical protein Ecym_6406 [Eremothecium cymbalariae DBVPG\
MYFQICRLIGIITYLGQLRATNALNLFTSNGVVYSPSVVVNTIRIATTVVETIYCTPTKTGLSKQVTIQPVTTSVTLDAPNIASKVSDTTKTVLDMAMPPKIANLNALTPIDTASYFHTQKILSTTKTAVDQPYTTLYNRDGSCTVYYEDPNSEDQFSTIFLTGDMSVSAFSTVTSTISVYKTI